MSEAQEATVLKYPVLLGYDADYDGYVVEVPDLPGCLSQGKTEAQALDNVREAIELYVETLGQDADPVPPPT
ncbi:MAG: type II toxin-antitoxin system HicB family antitoxin [Armatimonadota bacterium]